ncbi:uncharacterized protein LOC105203193 [Solenopsis invicta]|nr:uncharacterized protein LOC105203193 [Solenopsis invicta]
MPNITFLSTIGALSEFNIGEDWNLYQERLGQYFVANQVSQERKVAVLITLVGQEAYKILKDLCDPTLPECKSYEELCEILKKQFAPRVSVFKERIEFYELKQKEKESVNEWFARIKSKAINCKFGAQLDDKIKDRFVTGLSKGRILDRVCEEEHTTTLQSILEVARKKEAALASSSKASLVDVHNLKSGKAKSAQQVTFQKKKKEEKTGSQHQGSKEELKCVHCGGTSKEGHLAKICKNNKSTVANTNYLESGSNDKDTEIVDMYNLSNVLASEEPLIVKVEIEAFKEKISKQLEELEKKGVIEPIDTSAWGTPLVPVIKKDGSIRICVDYKITVNKFLEDVKHPLPRIEELFTALSGGESFTKLDLTAAYNQLEVTERTITGANKEEHLKNLREVFKRLSEAGFKVNLKKSVFFQPEIKYLGHVINKEGLHKDPEKVAAMLEAPKPKNVSEVKAFVGMVNYYGKFVPNLSQVLIPLYELQRSTTFKWTQQCEEAFNNVKNELASERNLVHFNKKWKLKLVCDASKVGIGAVLLHVLPDSTEKPISFASRVLHDAEKNYSHKGIPQMAAGRLQRWALFLSGFQYKFEHIKGIQNGGADGLSRLPRPIKIKEAEVEDYFHFVTAERTPIDATQIKKELRKDNILSKVYLYTRDGWPNSVSEEIKVFASKANEIGIENDILMWGYRVIVPFKFRKALLEEIHGAHLGMAKMKMIARQYFWWPNIDKEIEEYVKDCEACKTTANNPNKSPLIKFQEAEFPFDRIHIDFAGPFKGKTYLIVVDAFTKWPEVFEMSNTNTESTIEKLRQCFARFGLPRMIFSDNGRQFVSEEFENFCKNNGIKHRTSAPYYPSTNGLAENAVGSFKKGLSKALADKRNASLSTTTLINRYLASYRNAPHTSVGESPSKLMFGREIRTRLSLLNRPERDKAREKQVQYFKGNREILLKPGDIVYVRDYKIPTKPTWRKAIIKSKIGNRTYVCKTLDSEELIWKRHIEQIIEAGKFYSEEEDCMSKSDKDNKKSDSKELEVVQEPEKDNVCESPEETKTDINVKPKRIIKPVQRLNL